jgi:N-acetylneuraminic acid mutarotase
VTFNNGGRYDPIKDQWAPLPPVNLEARMELGFVWTGKELLVWGGVLQGGQRTCNTGARYDPKRNRWSLLPEKGAPTTARGMSVVWTGKEMIVWGGGHPDGESKINQPLRTGARYNPETDSWRPVSDRHTLEGRFYHAAAWTGAEMVIWGGNRQAPNIFFNNGARYNPATDSWTPMAESNTGRARSFATTTWTGQNILFFGGSVGGSEAFNDLDCYFPPSEK